VTVQAAPPPVATKADIAHALSGEVPNGVVKSRPLAGPLEGAVIQFGRASSGLGGNDYQVLSQVAQMFRRNGGTVRIVAHASQDVNGSSAETIERGNYEVSKRRALVIVAQLERMGVPKSSIIAEAASDSEPAYGTDTARGVAANRRAEVYIDF
jgi:outer membrane protein OmpA-like peptidoglycan-associated protein